MHYVSSSRLNWSSASRRRRVGAEPVRIAVAITVVLIGFAASAALGLGRSTPSEYVVSKLVADVPGHARNVDAALVNAWGIAASPTGPWWTSNEARGSSTLYSGAGRKQLLAVTVDGGPTGVAFNGGKGFRVAAGHTSDPARFIYACEDGKLRAWTPTVPAGWSTRTEVVVDEGGEAAVFRGVALAGGRVFATLGSTSTTAPGGGSVTRTHSRTSRSRRGTHRSGCRRSAGTCS
jgi:hypothetical protein